MRCTAVLAAVRRRAECTEFAAVLDNNPVHLAPSDTCPQRYDSQVQAKLFSSMNI